MKSSKADRNTHDPLVLLPLQQVTRFWNWLPAFRAVAEFGGVLRAGRVLRTSPSALSRTVRLLEEAVGEPLFVRVARSLVLTAAGEELLAATRGAMRNVHDATGKRAPSGPISIATTSRLGTVRLLPALRKMRRQHADIEPTVASITHADLAPALLAGRLDVGITLAKVTHPSLVCESLAPAESAVYCGRAHPLFGKSDASPRQVLRYPFAAPTISPGEREYDGWPEHLTRKVNLHFAVMEPGIDACVGGELLAVLPLEIVRALGLSSRVRALTSIPIAAAGVFAVRRRSATRRRWPAELLVAFLMP